MKEKTFYIASAVLAVLLIAFSLVWPQGEGKRSPAPFGHAITQPDYYRMVRERDQRKAAETAQKAADAKRDASLQAAAEVGIVVVFGGPSRAPLTQTAFIFGYGFIGQAFAERARAAGFALTATARTPEKRQALDAQGIAAVDPDDATALAQAATADVILITPAPTDDGCPAFAMLEPHITPGCWIGYLSTTGVYGDRGGGWVFEDATLLPSSAEGRRRVAAEDQWLTLGAHIFRLPGLYGPGRNVIERLKAGDARRVHLPGHVFSRLHHDDCATAVMASVGRPNPGRAYNLCDDEPASAEDVLMFAAELTGLPLPPATAFEDLPLARRFYADNKRVANARAKAELGWRPQYPTYRDGLKALWATIYRTTQTA